MKMTEKPQILVVDDEEYSREPVAEFLRLKGFLVEEASNGDEALKKFKEKSCNLVITDMCAANQITCILPVIIG
jgi:CheY-like chemotaxis protein